MPLGRLLPAAVDAAVGRPRRGSSSTGGRSRPGPPTAATSPTSSATSSSTRSPGCCTSTRTRSTRRTERLLSRFYAARLSQRRWRFRTARPRSTRAPRRTRGRAQGASPLTSAPNASALWPPSSSPPSQLRTPRGPSRAPPTGLLLPRQQAPPIIVPQGGQVDRLARHLLLRPDHQQQRRRFGCAFPAGRRPRVQGRAGYARRTTRVELRASPALTSSSGVVSRTSRTW